MNAAIYAGGVVLAGADASGVAADRETATLDGAFGAGRDCSSGRFVGRFFEGTHAF